jgi:cell wall-associated NlpC family hydrolase
MQTRLTSRSQAIKATQVARATPAAALLPAFLLASLLAGCATPPAPFSRSTPADSRPVVSRLSPDEANDVTIYAISLVGTPYRYGGNTPDSGFDCSGLIGHVYRTRARIAAPRTVASLVGWGQAVPADQVRTGDLVVFAQGGVATHAGIYVGDGRFVHAPSTGGEVRLDQLTSKYWARQPVTFRRP